MYTNHPKPSPSSDHFLVIFHFKEGLHGHTKLPQSTLAHHHWPDSVFHLSTALCLTTEFPFPRWLWKMHVFDDITGKPHLPLVNGPLSCVTPKDACTGRVPHHMGWVHHQQTTSSTGTGQQSPFPCDSERHVYWTGPYQQTTSSTGQQSPFPCHSERCVLDRYITSKPHLPQVNSPPSHVT